MMIKLSKMIKACRTTERAKSLNIQVQTCAANGLFRHASPEVLFDWKFGYL